MERHRLKGFESHTMVFVAACFDTLQMLFVIVPIFPWLISIVAFGTFLLWFKLNGVSFTRPSRAVKYFGSMLVELIPLPFLSVIPAVTIGVLSTIHDVHKEDQEYNKTVRIQNTGRPHSQRRGRYAPQQA